MATSFLVEAVLSVSNWKGRKPNNIFRKTSYHFLYRNVFSIKSQIKLVCACTGMATFASTTAMTAADDGILLSTEPSAQLQRRLMEWSIYMEMVPKRTCTALAILKGCVRKSPKALCAWDSG